ncbi:MAG: hypothetical protein U1E51_04950 [Candidatus Binatia bacterium]|nr:hypothetical protein [Candidatus Binatia bacterium]
MNCDPRLAGVDRDLAYSIADPALVLVTLDPLLVTPIKLSAREFDDLVSFVCDGLLDPRARPEKFCGLIPRSVPSRGPMLFYEGC